MSGAGKTTLTISLEDELKRRDYEYIQRLDGDIVRENLTRDLTFTKEDRDENIRRITFVASLLSKNGVGVMVSAISPYIEAREKAREKCHNFIEIYMKCGLNTLIKRDVKGLYKKAINGEISNFTGIDDPYEEPPNPEIIIHSDRESEEESLKKIIDYLLERGLLDTED